MSEFEDDLLLVMRVYIEKPRTTVGWKGAPPPPAPPRPNAAS